MVPGSSGLRHAVVFAASDKEGARLLGSKRAPVSEYVCGESRDEWWGGD